MTSVGFAITLVVAALASLFMAWVIGAGSSGATPFAPAVGANAISVMRAALIVGVLGFLGAVVQGGNVTQAVGSGLIDGVTLTPMAVILALVTAGGLMAVGIFTGYPIATAFTVTGTIIGAGLALGGAPAWPKYQQIAAMWILAPVVDGLVAYGLASVLPRPDVPERYSVPVIVAAVGAVLATVQFSFLGPAGVSQSLATVAATATPAFQLAARVGTTAALAGTLGVLAWADARHNVDAALRHVLLGLGGLVAFSAGGSQVGLAVGPLVPLLDTVAVPITAILVGGGFGLLVGSWTGAPRMIKSLSQDYSSLGPRRSISALFPSFLMAQLAVYLGVPVSFNEILVAAILGSGMAVSGGEGVSSGKLTRTIGAWIGSFVVAFAIGYGALVILPT